GARNEIIAFQVIVDSGGKPLKAVSLKIAANGPDTSFVDSARVYRLWYVQQGDWYPETCIPLSDPVDIPAPDNAVPNQRNQAFLVETLIPREMAAGTHRFTVEVSAGGKALHRLPF